jgi:plasmid maintenance system antidote protein VapI
MTELQISKLNPGDRIRILLIEQKIWQNELARRMGVPQQRVCDLIAGRIRISRLWAYRLSQALPEYTSGFFTALQWSYDNNLGTDHD